MAAYDLRKAIASIARDFKVSAVWMFGSALENEDQAADMAKRFPFVLSSANAAGIGRFGICLTRIGTRKNQT
jgi:hypothetical protein